MGGEFVFLLVSEAPALANGIPARMWGTCDGEMAFLLVSGGHAVAEWHSSLYLGRLRRHSGILRTWGTCGGAIILPVSFTLLTLPTNSALYIALGSLR